ncbi:response regulator [Enterococcus avium]
MEKKISSRILLIDDDQDILDLLEEVLKQDGFNHIFKAKSGAEAIHLFKTVNPHVAILDVMLPDIDGFDLCKEIRKFSTLSIIFLSSKNDEIDKILGLSSGGDDYVTKPFSPKEIVYRVRSQIRRLGFQSSDSQQSVITNGNLTIDIQGKSVYKNDQEIILTAKEYRLLETLFKNIGHIISKEQLYEIVWGELGYGIDNTLMVHIRHLREKIEDNSSRPLFIRTVRGLGYKMEKI